MIKKILPLIIIILFASVSNNVVASSAKSSEAIDTKKVIEGQAKAESAKPETNVDRDTRNATYQTMSTHLALQSNEALLKLLNHKKDSSSPTGILDVNGTRIFYKKIPLTDLEMKPENIMSTKNMFDLPVNFQYGFGSACFGAWRELFVHILTTNWVVTGLCPNFPLMYHWRVLPRKPIQLKNIDITLKRWGNLPVIRARFDAINKATHDLVLFLEYIPHSLEPWLKHKLSEGDNAAQEAVAMVERNLNSITSFMQSKGLLHFDAQATNILTDGKQLYFADFGLSISKQFELSTKEIEFFKSHHNYDLYESIQACLVMPIMEYVFKTDDMIAIKDMLQEFAQGKKSIKMLPAWAQPIIMRYAPITVIMTNFFSKFLINNNGPELFTNPIIFPSKELAQALREGQAKATALKKD